MSDRPSAGERSDRVRTFLRFLSWAGLLLVGVFVLLIGGNYPWLASQVVRVATQLLDRSGVATTAGTRPR